MRLKTASRVRCTGAPRRIRVAEPAGRTSESIVVGSFLLSKVSLECFLAKVVSGTLYRPRICL